MIKLPKSKSDWLYERQIPIMEELLGERITSRLYKSPFREDRSPTCSFYTAGSGRLYLKDWALDEIYDIVSFYCEKQGLSPTKDRVHAIDKMYKRFSGVETDNTNDNVRAINKQYAYEYIVAPWDTHKSYWEDYSITLNTLMFYSVYAVKSVYVNFNLSARSTKENPIFAYNFPSRRIKFYRPKADKHKKWSGNSTEEDISGLAQLREKGKLLIVTKSMKDVMCLYELGFSAISPNGEGIRFDKKLIKNLKKRFEYIVVLYDNDEAGRKHSVKMASDFSCKAIFLTKHKDISDSVKGLGKPKTNSILKKILSRAFKA